MFNDLSWQYVGISILSQYETVVIKDLDPSDVTAAVRSPSQGDGRSERRSAVSSDAKLLARIDKTELPPEYDAAKHQEYVDRRWPKLSPEQVARALQLWKVKQEIDPEMPNQGFSFVKILAYVADEEGRAEQPAPAANPEP